MICNAVSGLPPSVYKSPKAAIFHLFYQHYSPALFFDYSNGLTCITMMRSMYSITIDVIGCFPPNILQNILTEFMI